MNPKKNSNLKELQTIPRVGKKIARDLWNIGIEKVSDLKGKYPEELYLKICADQECQVDRCVLYGCRSSVYFADNRNLDPEKLK